ncbi:MAG: hypothetical protein OEM67_01150 [Thermoleophilia bacterium]|nr:hypothetical protein [Thermoleophilia bacterium]
MTTRSTGRLIFSSLALAATFLLGGAVALGVLVTGTSGPDSITGTSSADLIRAQGGSDIVRAGGGPDTVIADDGNDRLFGQQGNDRLSGNAGNDRIDAGQGSDRLFGGPGADVLLGQSGNDVLSGGKGRDQLRGAAGNDVLNGGSGRDRIDGGGGADRLLGARGRDTLLGGPGADRLSGGGGNDTVNGLGGVDVVIGGGGADLLLGGSGRDQVRARDKVRDAVNCGPGRDVAVADFFERVVNACERVLRPAASAALKQDATGRAFGGVEARINSIAENANAIVMAADPDNPPPPVGRQFHIVNVAILNGSSTARELSFAALGSSGRPETSFSDKASCGTIPNALPQRSIAPGESLQGNVCWSIETRDIGRLVMLVDDRSGPTQNGIAIRMG